MTDTEEGLYFGANASPKVVLTNPPKVTPAEELLYGDLAGVVRLLGQASASSTAAHILIRENLKKIDMPDDWAADIASKAWTAHDAALRAHREIALIVLERMTAEREGVPLYVRAHRSASYPYEEGEITVLGPEIFAGENDTGETVICWKGENYVPQR